MTKPTDQIQIRIAVFGAIALVAFSVLLGRLWYLQGMRGSEYTTLAEENRIRIVSINPPRGDIYDRNGKLLVTNRPVLTVSIIPSVVEDRPYVLKRVAKVLGMPLEEVEKRLESKTADPLKPRVIKEDVDEKIVTYLKEHQSQFPGVEVEVTSARAYPHGSLAAHVLGYVGEVSEKELEKEEFKENELGDIVGKTGIERSYESLLKGVKGEEKVEVNAVGRRLRTLNKKDPIPGHNLILTIDADIQAKTEAALAFAISSAQAHGHSDAKAGAAVVLDPQNGEVIALASYPPYDPSLFIGGISTSLWQALNAKGNNFPLLNRVTSASYPPGSTFKPITGIAGLAENLISPSTGVICRGVWQAFGKKWAKYCWKRSGHGQVGFKRAIVESCDIYFYEVGHKFWKLFKQTGAEKFQEWSRKFGFGAPTGIDLPSEGKGRVPDQAWKRKFNENNPRPDSRKWMPGDTVNMAIGQGDLLVTPLQLANAYAAIINGGRLLKPRVVKSHSTPDGEIVADFKTEQLAKIDLPSSIFANVQSGLAGVTTTGTAHSAFAGFSVPVAGKTGTAQVLGKDDFAWFVCYGPVDNPRYVVAVLIEQGGHGGSVAAPAARQILSHIFGVPEEIPVAAEDVSR